MSTKLKKTILIIISIIAIAVIALFIYAYFESRNNGKTIPQTIVDIFPHSSNVENPPPPVDTGTGTGQATSTPPVTDTFQTDYINRLRRISDTPVTGGIFSSTSTVRYVDKATGNVYEYSYFNNTSRKITNTSIPKIYDSHWINKDVFVGRYLDTDNETIRSFVATIQNPGEKGTVSTVFLPPNITSIVASPNKSSFFYIQKDASNANGVIYNLKTENSSIVALLPNDEFRAVWNDNGLYVETNSSYELSGYVFKISQSGGDLSYIIGPVAGLSTFPIPGGLTLSSFQKNVASYFYDEKTHKYTKLSEVIVPEKCALGKTMLYCATNTDTSKEGFPDTWYRGDISSTDTVLKINLSDPNDIKQEFTPLVTDIEFDMTRPSIADDEKTIIFINKKDSYLWSLDLY